MPVADSAGLNKTTGTGKDAAKLDRETEETHRTLACVLAACTPCASPLRISSSLPMRLMPFMQMIESLAS